MIQNRPLCLTAISLKMRLEMKERKKVIFSQFGRSASSPLEKLTGRTPTTPSTRIPLTGLSTIT
ncbi:hypothetical protein RLOC_00009028 [Lonchura striata]|uniref:Uncharacterized protein n=1 Tax=Lonchura striata TaxID=40157 RepID=A0A218V2D5_9PASE|nr:hypothetical protein RLOC_00009028 [Lonchura striata domestica]